MASEFDANVTYIVSGLKNSDRSNVKLVGAIGHLRAAYGQSAASLAGSAMAFCSRYSSKPATPISRPTPDCL